MTGPHLATRAGAAISRRRTGPSGKTGPSGEPGPPGAAGQSWGTRAARLLGRHWLLVVLLAAGLALRIAAQIAYQPALIYVDTLKYLYGASPGADPLGYTLVLRSILVFGGLGLVALAQHLLGLALAMALYAVLLRRGTNRWLAAVAVAPVLLDAYQVQIEQTIMPDVWFEAMIVAGLGVLLWRPAVTVRLAAVAGVILGLSATVHQVGEVLIVPAVCYRVVAAGNARRAGTTAVALAVAFVLPIVLYCGVSYLGTGHFRLARGQATVGRVVGAADCASLALPPAVRPLCPTPAEQAKGPDWLEHSKYSPLHAAAIPAGASRGQLTSELTSAIKSHQPLRILGGIVRDSVRVFAVTRTPNPWVTPLSRWQFQTTYPTYPHWVTLGPGNVIVVGVQRVAFGQFHFSKLKPAYGGKAQVNRPVASFLRSYQLGVGFTPGPFLLLCTLVGVVGTLLAVVLQVRQARSGAQDPRAARARQLALACLLFPATAVVLLLAQDLVEFSWRYQLPAVITLPPAGILGVSALLALRRSGAEPAGRRDSAEPAARQDGAAAYPVNGSAPQAGERPDQAGGEGGPAGA
ncbi:MAG: hypothetical protein ACR2MP_04315 [Streptosporangiaceae bacterium]